MQIFIKSIDRTLTVDCEPTTSVEALKALVEDIEFVPADQQKLMSGTTQLIEGSLAECGVEGESTITLALGIVGGAHKNNPWKKSSSQMRWKWQKKRTRRLQRKRRKMRMRAR